MAIATMQQGQERQTVEQAIESQSAQEWQRTIQQIEQLANQGQLPQHYKHSVRVVRENSKKHPEQVLSTFTAMPPSTKAALFELVTGLVRTSEQYGPQQAEQVANFLCSTFTQAARQGSQQES